MSNENPFLKGPRVQGGNPFLNGPRIPRPSPLVALGSPEYQARAQNLTRSRSHDAVTRVGDSIDPRVDYSQIPTDPRGMYGSVMGAKSGDIARMHDEFASDNRASLKQSALNVVGALPSMAAGLLSVPANYVNGLMQAQYAAQGTADGWLLPTVSAEQIESAIGLPGFGKAMSEGVRASQAGQSDKLAAQRAEFDATDGAISAAHYLLSNPSFGLSLALEQAGQFATLATPGGATAKVLGGAALAGGMNANEVQQDLAGRVQRGEITAAEASRRASNAFGLSAAANTLIPKALGSNAMTLERIASGAARSAASNAGSTAVLRGAGRGFLGEGLQGGLSEVADGAVKNHYTDKPLLADAGKNFVLGFGLEAMPGAAGGAVETLQAGPPESAKPSDTLRSELLTLGEELAGRDVVREETRHVPSMPQRVQKDPGIVPEDASDIDALLMRNLPQRGRAKLVANPMPQGLGEQLAAGTVFDSAPPVLDATRIGDALAGVDFAQQAPKLDAVLLGELLAGDVLSRQPESSPEAPMAAGSLFSGEVKTEAPQGAQAEMPVKHGEVGQSDAKPVGGRPSLLLRAKEIIRNALRLSKADKRYTESHELMGVSESEVAEARENGLDILGYKHAVDGSAIRHVFKNHGNAKKEAARGQIAITDADFERIPEILESPDKRIYGLKNDIGREMVGYLKTMPDGTTFYLEEVRTGRRTLTAQSMRKYPRTTSAASIEKTLRPTSETLPGDGGSVAQSGAKETLYVPDVEGSAANIGRTGGDVRADSAPPAEPVAEPQKNSTTVMQHRNHPHAVSVGSRPAQVDIEDAVKAQSEPKRSNRDDRQRDNAHRQERAGGAAAQRGDSAAGQRFAGTIPRGLPARRDADSDRLVAAINRHIIRTGGRGDFDAQTVQQEGLPDALATALRLFELATGTRVVIFRNLTPEVDDFNGVTFGDGTAYVSENNQYPLTLTAAHEWLHNLRKSNPELYWELADEVIRQGDLPGYQQRLKREGETRWRNMDLVAEELTAAAVSDALTDPEFLQRLATRNRGLFRRVAEAFLDFLNTLTRGWRDQGSNQYLQDVETFRDKLAAVLEALPENGSTDVEAMFSRKAQTQEAYEARIDALFAGAKGNRQGVRILDRADMLDMLGHGDKPLHLVESAVGKKDSAGRVKHPGMTAEMWKRLPEWIENPVAAFESDTVDGRITLVAPDLVDGKPALVVLEPNGSMAGMDVHVAVNAYEKDNAAGVPTARWVRDGKLLYLDQKRSPTFSERSGLQLPRDVRQLRGYKHRVQTEADLHKYRAERDEAMFSRREENIRKAKDKADAKREEVRQSLAVSAKAAGWNYDTSKWEGRRGQRNRLRVEMQDKMLAWRDVQNQIEEKLGEVIPDAANVYRLENLMHGRVGEGLDRLERNAFEPLIKAMHAAKVDTAALEEYLYALHARERNADIAAKNPKMPDGGSGMTNAEAEAILAKADHAKMAPLAQMVRRIIRQTRQRMLVHGLITQETFDALNAQYEWYVPLRGKPEKEPWIQRNKSGAGRGLDGRGKQVQEALGRGAGNLATDLLANVFRDAQMSVINAEKARVGRGLMRLVLMNPNPGLWQVEPVQTERALNSEGEVVERVMYDFSDPSIIAVRHNGNLYRVQVNSAPLAEAMTHAGVEHLDKVFRMAGSINRYFSAVLTKYNPSFTLVNASRDMIFGLTGLAVEHGEKAALQAAMRYPQAAKAAWRQARGQFDAENEWDVWAREFVEHGGKTGMIHVHDVEAISRDIGKGLLREASTAKQVGKAAVEAIGHANDAVENALRLSAYVTLRQQGMSADKAAEYAKNLTVNFNRKGYLGSKMNAWFLFYNASIQGSHRTIKLMKRPKTWGYLGALALAQAVSALAMMGMEDEDGRTLWEQIPEHVKQRNLVIPTGGDSFAAVPMPYGFNWFVYMSGQTVQAVNGNPEKSVSEKAGAMAEKAASALVQAFSPVPLDDGALGLLPTVFRIPANVQVNRNDFGNAIRRENPYSKSDIPRASQGRADTMEIFKLVAKGLNRVGGGDDYRAPKFKTLFDWAPEDLEYLVKTATGGMGKFVIDTATLGGKAMEGDDVEVTVRDVPIINRFASQVDERSAQAALFYERRKTMDEYLREARGILKAEGVMAARRFIATRPELEGVIVREQKGGAVLKAQAGSLYAAYKDAEKGSTERNDAVNAAYAGAPAWPWQTEASRERNRQVRKADQVLTDKRKLFNQRWEKAVDEWVNR